MRGSILPEARNLKSEIRNALLGHRLSAGCRAARRLRGGFRKMQIPFGFRVSDFFRPSAFGFRISSAASVPLFALSLVLLGAAPWATAQTANYEVFVSNEKSGDLTVIDGASLKVTATIPVGKRPRGVHASNDGKTIYVALSGTPISGPPELDAKGNPILHKGGDDDDDDAKADKAADGIGIVDAAQKKFLRKIPAGSDPEQFCLSADGRQLYIANEDVATASVLDIASGKVEHIIRVTREPEGVAVNPNGKSFYVGCETAGDIFVVDTKTFGVIERIKVNPRPRSVDFTPDGTRAFASSESAGQVNFIDALNHKLIKAVDLPKGSRPMCIKTGPGGKKLYASTGRGGNVCVLDADSGEVLKMIKVGARPWGLEISPDGKLLFVANGPSNDVSVVDLAEEKEVQRIKAGEGPWGLVAVTKAD
jgi:YVTN family beta-propeller protein